MIDRIKKYLDDHREVLLWVPVVFGLILGAMHFFPVLDPRTGLDGLGQIMAMLVNVLGGVVAAFMAWLTKKHYLGNEAPLNSDPSLYWKDRLINLMEWALCFVFWAFVVFA